MRRWFWIYAKSLSMIFDHASLETRIIKVGAALKISGRLPTSGRIRASVSAYGDLATI
jgi:hypothetical protein